MVFGCTLYSANKKVRRVESGRLRARIFEYWPTGTTLNVLIACECYNQQITKFFSCLEVPYVTKVHKVKYTMTMNNLGSIPRLCR